MTAFIIWSIVAAGLLVLALVTLRMKKPAAFFAGVKAPEVRDVRRFNRRVALLWACFAAAFELMGLPFLWIARQKALIVLPLLGVPFAAIALAAGYHLILDREKKR